MNGYRITSIAFCVAVLIGPPLGGAERLWVEVKDGGPEAQGSARPRVFKLDADRLEAALDLATLGGVGALEIRPIIELPLPDGSFGRFRVEASPVMAPGLAIRYPEIRTFRGTGIDDPAAAVWFDLIPKGFHGMILSGGETVFINPHPNSDHDHYLSFERGGIAPGIEQRFECQIEGTRASGREAVSTKETGPLIRTYRTAIAATGEYTQYHGGTRAEALSAIVVVMNRINGIFRRELGVQFELVADNDWILFTDPDTDPYTHDDTAVLVFENQATLDSIIGTVNYDHGHLFNTHNGGRAGDFGTPCNSFTKGQGVSGLRVPEGEVFMVDLVAHEMGHQLGAAHTYNSLEHVCSIARHEWAAYEPGSGSTIMSYAGVCRNENIQAHSDDYFHGFSLDEISAFLDGAGSTCGTVASTGNEPPQVQAGPGYTIPAQTPFVLDGSATDASPLTLTWEQFDLGPPSPPMSDDGLRPLFRSHPPSEVSRRALPPMEDLLQATGSIGEALPTTTRALTFRLTARDGLGGVGSDSTVLQVDGDAGPFEVRAPAAGDRWAAGEPAVVEWDVAGTDTGPIACDAVDILVSMDNGATFPVVLAEATPNDGIHEITVPFTTTDQARVMVTCSDNIFFAISPRYSVLWSQSRPSGGRRTPG